MGHKKFYLSYAEAKNHTAALAGILRPKPLDTRQEVFLRWCILGRVTTPHFASCSPSLWHPRVLGLSREHCTNSCLSRWDKQQVKLLKRCHRRPSSTKSQPWPPNPLSLSKPCHVANMKLTVFASWLKRMQIHESVSFGLVYTHLILMCYISLFITKQTSLAK